MTMPGIDQDRVLRAARLAYELGRARTALVRALAGGALVAAVALLSIGRDAFAWLPLAVAALAFAEWRGGALARGARRGALGGLVALVVPLSILRPCCAGDPSMHCTMPLACVGAGAVLGLALAPIVPRVSEGSRARAAAGVALGAVSVAAVRCSALVIGEALGLVGGLLAAAVIGGAARAWLDARRASA